MKIATRNITNVRRRPLRSNVTQNDVHHSGSYGNDSESPGNTYGCERKTTFTKIIHVCAKPICQQFADVICGNSTAFLTYPGNDVICPFTGFIV